MICPSWAALQGTAYSFTELHKLFHQDKTGPWSREPFSTFESLFVNIYILRLLIKPVRKLISSSNFANF